MRVGVLSRSTGDEAYLVEILKTWGVCALEIIRPNQISMTRAKAVPVMVWPEGPWENAVVEAGLSYIRSGGHVVTFRPKGEFAAAAKISHVGESGGAWRLCVSDLPYTGFAGEEAPLPVPVTEYDIIGDATVHAHLNNPGTYTTVRPGLLRADCGKGGITIFAFDVASCVRQLRQGDPARSDFVPSGDVCCRASHLACDLGEHDAGWAPFADLIARVLVESVIAEFRGPYPLLHHLPGDATGLLLYSGDEDGYPKIHNDVEMEAVQSAGGRMNLYIFPEQTDLTPADVGSHSVHHDIGPHPNIRPLGMAPVSERVAEMERQIAVFESRFRTKAVSVRNHSFAWAGYLEPAEMLERMGVGMDVNFSSGAYLRRRDHSPYGAFGGAMPMRFARTDGSLIDVFQQHTHLSDDMSFSPDAEYSQMLSPAQATVVFNRMFDDMILRFHTPLLVNIHPINWSRFSELQGRALLSAAAARNIPVWSVDQWLEFWRSRERVYIEAIEWENGILSFRVESHDAGQLTSVFLPSVCDDVRLSDVTEDGKKANLSGVSLFQREGVLIRLGADSVHEVKASYIRRTESC